MTEHQKRDWVMWHTAAAGWVPGGQQVGFALSPHVTPRMEGPVHSKLRQQLRYFLSTSEVEVRVETEEGKNGELYVTSPDVLTSDPKVFRETVERVIDEVVQEVTALGEHEQAAWATWRGGLLSIAQN
ncbi:MAG: hypothetical protein M3Y42_19095 [Actinomycetota bacterium]|nr:hypothetical protein [Actinomycetota bacterium]MDQ2959049.1 hypothetical protein [Actinomycetota bacterium]